MDATLRIKNLSIALEALSRVNTITSYKHSQDIEGLLAQEIRDFQRETQWPKQGPAKPETQHNPFTNNEDEIPF